MGNQSYGGEGGDSWVTSLLNHIFTGKKDARVFLSNNILIRRELACVVQKGDLRSAFSKSTGRADSHVLSLSAHLLLP